MMQKASRLLARSNWKCGLSKCSSRTAVVCDLALLPIITWHMLMIMPRKPGAEELNSLPAGHSTLKRTVCRTRHHFYLYFTRNKNIIKGKRGFWIISTEELHQPKVGKRFFWMDVISLTTYNTVTFEMI